MRIPIVNEQDEVIGEEERSTIHQKGILHREAHIVFVTPDDKIIFQKRGLNKETYPGLLDLTVGGHVDAKEDSYQVTAERESLEETGVNVKGKLIPVRKIQTKSFDKTTNLINNRFTTIFTYLYNGNIQDLKLEDPAALGFEIYSINELEQLRQDDKKFFIQRLISEDFLSIYKEAINKIHENKN